MGAGLTISIFFTCQTFIFWIFWKQIIWYLEEKFAKIHLPISQFYLLPGDGHWDMWSPVLAILKIKKTDGKLFLTNEIVKNTEKGNFGVSIVPADGLGMLGVRTFADMVITVFNAMMTSSNRNIFRVTGPLGGKFTGQRWISLTKASDADLWCFLWLGPQQMVE